MISVDPLFWVSYWIGQIWERQFVFSVFRTNFFLLGSGSAVQVVIGVFGLYRLCIHTSTKTGTCQCQNTSFLSSSPKNHMAIPVSTMWSDVHFRFKILAWILLGRASMKKWISSLVWFPDLSPPPPESISRQAAFRNLEFPSQIVYVFGKTLKRVATPAWMQGSKWRWEIWRNFYELQGATN